MAEMATNLRCFRSKTRLQEALDAGNREVWLRGERCLLRALDRSLDSGQRGLHRALHRHCGGDLT